MRANQAKERMRLDAMKISFGCLATTGNDGSDAYDDDDDENDVMGETNDFTFGRTKCKCRRSRFKYAPLN